MARCVLKIRIPRVFLVNNTLWCQHGFVELPHSHDDSGWDSITAIRAVDVIQKIEHKPGKPVITAVQAMFWQSLRAAGYTGKVSGYGRLLRL